MVAMKRYLLMLRDGICSHCCKSFPLFWIRVIPEIYFDIVIAPAAEDVNQRNHWEFFGNNWMILAKGLRPQEYIQFPIVKMIRRTEERTQIGKCVDNDPERRSELYIRETLRRRQVDPCVVQQSHQGSLRTISLDGIHVCFEPLVVIRVRVPIRFHIVAIARG